MRNRTLQGPLVAVLATLLVLAFAELTCAAQVMQSTTTPCYHKEVEDFGFLEGSWIVEAHMRQGDEKWEQSSATSEIKRDLAGCLFHERFSGVREGHAFTALAVLAFNSTSGKLQRMWSDSEHGLLILYEGNREGNDVTLDTEVLLRGNKVKLRNVYLITSQESFTLESRRSHDDGKTWITVSKLKYRRK